MEFYVIPPLSALPLMNYGDRFFCLAQLWMKSPEYREFFRQKRAEGKWVTLDNGAGDHDLVTEKDLLMIMQDLKPSEVIPLDVITDGIQTIRNLETFTRTMYDLGIKGVEVLGCPQGANKEEWMFVYKYMLRHPMVTTIGMSKIAIPLAFLDETNDSHIKEARQMCVASLSALDLIQKPLHFLGMGDPTEFRDYKKIPNVRSTDSCNTVWAGMNGQSFEQGLFKRIPTPRNYFDRDIANIQYSIALSNINWFRKELA